VRLVSSFSLVVRSRTTRLTKLFHFSLAVSCSAGYVLDDKRGSCVPKKYW